MDKTKFKKACDACGKTYDDVASKLGVTRSTLYRKMDDDSFCAYEIKKVGNFLRLSMAETFAIFFDGVNSWLFEETKKLESGDSPAGEDPVRGSFAADGKGICKGSSVFRMFSDVPELFRIVDGLLVKTDKDLLDVEDIKALTGLETDTCYRLIRKIKEVSDVFGISGHVHRVDYIMYLVMMILMGWHRD